MTAPITGLTDAEVLTACQALIGRTPGDPDPYTGPEPMQEYLSGGDCDRHADVEHQRRERQTDWWLR